MCLPEAFRFARRGGANNFQTRSVKEPSFVTLRMKWSGGRACSRRHPHNHVCCLPPPPMRLCQVVDDLVESLCYKISKLHLNHRFHSFHGEPQACADNSSFTQRSISHAFLSKPRHESFGYLENSSVVSDVLSHQHQVLVALHALPKSITNCVDESFFRLLAGSRRYFSLCVWRVAVS